MSDVQVDHQDNYTPHSPPGDRSTLATVSLVLGIISILSGCVTLVPIPFLSCCSIPLAIVLGIAGLVTGFMGLQSSARTQAIVGLVLSGLGILIPIVLIIIVFVLGIGLAIMDPGTFDPGMFDF